MSRFRLFGAINKSEEQDDGTLIVSGTASTNSVDSQGEIVTADAMKAAIPDYMKFGAVREMHDTKKAAGTAVEISVNDRGSTDFSAHIVDPLAVKKVQTGVYKGFSIGGKVLDRDKINKSMITSLSLTEISLVDRPANPDAVFQCYKAAGVDEEMAEDPASDVVSNHPDLVDSNAEDASPASAGNAPAKNAPKKTPVENEVDNGPQNVAVDVIDDGGADKNAPKMSAAEPVMVKAVIDGKDVNLRKNDNGTFEVVDDVSKNCYSLSQLAQLCESLRYLADTVSWEGNAQVEGQAMPSEIPAEIRAAAKSLYATLLKLVSHDVEVATAQIDAASAPYAASADLADLAKAFGVDEVSSDALKKAFDAVVADRDALKKVADEYLAKPAAPKGTLLEVAKGEPIKDDLDKVVSDENLPIEQRALAAIQKAHQGGGVRLM